MTTSVTTGNGPGPVRPRNRKGGGKLHGLARVLAIILLVLVGILIVGTIFVIGYVGKLAKEVPDWTDANFANAQTSFVYDRNGDEIAELHRGENRIAVSISDIPQHVIDCFLGTEDTRFYDHFGVDVYRVFGALIADLKAGSMVQGASTITMQLARNAILEDNEKAIERKIKEAIIAMQIEKEYSKDEILEMYLNEIYFGHGCYGIEAASLKYFNKSVRDIDLAEAAVLTGVVRGWVMYSPLKNPENSLRVRDQVLNNLVEYKPEYAEQVAAALEEPLTVASATEGQEEQNTASSDSATEPYGWFKDAIVDEAENRLVELGYEASAVYTGGFHIYTTMDPSLQLYMEGLYRDDDLFPSSPSEDIVQSSMVFMDHSNGEILALVGGRNRETQRGFNRATDLRRQPGSVFKPIAVYAAALENGYGPGSVANDCYTQFGSNYKPTNYDGRFRGIISMRTAIQYSVNVPAVKFMQKIGVATGYDMAEQLGISLAGEQDMNLALALGGMTYGTNPKEIAGAYGTFANGGVYNEPHVISKIVGPTGEVVYEASSEQRAVMSEANAYLMTDMLETVTKSGTGTNARMSNHDVASKTGTTQLPDTPVFANIRTGNKDAWFAAYTPEYVAVVWMGYDNDQDSDGNPQYLRQIYGGKYPAQLWKLAMTEALKDAPASSFTKPADIVSVAIDTKSGMLPSSSTPSSYIGYEIYSSSNVPTETSTAWKKSYRICTVSHKLATNYCPSTTVGGGLIPPEEPEGNKILSYGADSHLISTSGGANVSGYCTVHTAPAAQDPPEETPTEETPSDTNNQGNGDIAVPVPQPDPGENTDSGDSSDSGQQDHNNNNSGDNNSGTESGGDDDVAIPIPQ